MKLILIFMNTMKKKKKQADKNECKYILFRIDIYFSECFLAVEIDEKGNTDRDIIFEKNRQIALEKKIGCKFIRINSKKIGNVQAFIDELKNKKIKKLEKKLIKEKQMRGKLEKEMREKLEKELKDKN